MRVFGTGTVGVPVDAVWAALADPDVLRRVIPGCERLDVTGPGRCELTVTTPIAAVAGTYSGQMEVRERQGPGLLLVAKVSAAGGRGGVGADVTVRLTQAGDGETELGYEIEAQVDGAIAGVGQLVLASVARRLAGEFIGGLAGPAGQQQQAGKARVGESLAGVSLAGELLAAAPRRPGRQPPVGQAPPAGQVPQVGDAPRAGQVPQVGDARRFGDALAAADARGVKAGLAAGAAVGLAGILIGAVLGRRGRGRPWGSR